MHRLVNFIIVFNWLVATQAMMSGGSTALAAPASLGYTVKATSALNNLRCPEGYRLGSHDIGNIVAGNVDFGLLGGGGGCRYPATTGVQFPAGSNVEYGIVSIAVGGTRCPVSDSLSFKS
jgi:hypothetical protein